MDKGADATHHEELALSKEATKHQASGTVRLIEDGEVILIPTPSPDPKGMDIFFFVDICLFFFLLTATFIDPLNLPQWHKWTITIVLGLCKKTQIFCSRYYQRVSHK